MEIQEAQADVRLQDFDNFACARESLSGFRTAQTEQIHTGR